MLIISKVDTILIRKNSKSFILPSFQILKPDFRLDYCRLWQALINSDMSKVERYSRRLGAGDLYPLFACILTARSWTAVNAGISSVPVTNSEVWSNTLTWTWMQYLFKRLCSHIWDSILQRFIKQIGLYKIILRKSSNNNRKLDKTTSNVEIIWWRYSCQLWKTMPLKMIKNIIQLHRL